jgi:uncharacterized small protein (DUF1192 family)
MTEAAMVAEDEDLPRKPARFERPVLDRWGIEELRSYIGELQEEIARAEAEITRKAGHRTAADAFFRRS